jgi:hypothetical protein
MQILQDVMKASWSESGEDKSTNTQNVKGSEELAGLEGPQLDGLVIGSASEESIVK